MPSDSAFAPDLTTLRAQAEQILRGLVGRDEARLRDDQWTAIEALVVGGRRVLVVQRTGWGKSAVYFVATALLRAQGRGPTVIISPLLALMRDQIAAAQRAGIRAVTINSTNVTEWDELHARIADGDVDVLLCSPERLNNPDFRDAVLPRLAADTGLVVVDEAHCISDWGHDFRPDYRRIRTLLGDLPPGVPVLATTATANSRVTDDVADQLSGSVPRWDSPVAPDATDDSRRAGAPGEVEPSSSATLILRGPLNRESLHLAVVRLRDQETRVAWLEHALRQIPGSGIIYTLTVAMAGQVAQFLRSAGIDAHAYTGQTDPAEREQLEDDLKQNRVKALVATSALGMGFDKPDLAFVIHLGAPSSPVAYYQQVGRAGRGVDDALVVLLPGVEDREIWDYFGSLSFPDAEQVDRTLQALRAGGVSSVAKLETAVDLRRSRLESMLKVLDVDGAVRRVKGGWEATGAPWHYDHERYARVEQARLAEQQLMVDYEATDQCRMAFLRRTLDDPDLAPAWRCGRCDNCGGASLPQAPSETEVTEARTQLRAPGIELTVRRQWPTSMGVLGVQVSGRIPVGEQPSPGRAIARLDGLGLSAALRELFDPATPDGDTPVALRHAAATVLGGWGDIDGVDGVVQVAPTPRPWLPPLRPAGWARSVGVPFVGWIGRRADRRDPGRHDVNSAMRAAGVLRRLELRGAGDGTHEAAPPIAGARLLLVDDYTDSGWTLAVASRLLRLAGAAEVLPFVLAQR